MSHCNKEFEGAKVIVNGTFLSSDRREVFYIHKTQQYRITSTVLNKGKLESRLACLQKPTESLKSIKNVTENIVIIVRDLKNSWISFTYLLTISGKIISYP